MSDYVKKAIDEYNKTKKSEKNSVSGNQNVEPEAKKYVFNQFKLPVDRENNDVKNAGKNTEKNIKQFVPVNSFIKETKKTPLADTIKNNLKKPDNADDLSFQEKEQNKYDKAAKMLLLLGKDEASSVIKHFKPQEVEKIAASLIKVKNIDKAEAASLLKEINKKIQLRETFSGGVDTARQMLYSAFGKEKGDEFLANALPERREKPFEFLKDVEPHVIKLVLKDEPVMMTAVVMNYLEPEKSAALLKEYNAEQQKEILLRIASGGKIQSGIFEKMEDVIKEKVRTIGQNVEYKIDGRNKLANILKFMDIKNEEEIIKDIKDFDPELSKEIMQKIYTLDIVFEISGKDMQKILSDFSDKEIAIILKGKEDAIKEKIFSALSSGRRELVIKESEYLGIMRKSEVNVAVKEFIDYLKQSEKDGLITINRPGGASPLTDS